MDLALDPADEGIHDPHSDARALRHCGARREANAGVRDRSNLLDQVPNAMQASMP